MITYYKNTETGLEKIDGVVNNCWMNVIDPTPEDIQILVDLGLPQDFVTYPLDLDERARTEKEDNGVTLIILRIPYFQGVKVDIPYTTIPLGVVMTDRFIVTICRSPNEILNELSSGRMRGLSTGKRNRFVLRILLSTASKFLMHLREINKVVESIEDRLQRSLHLFQKILAGAALDARVDAQIIEHLHQAPDHPIALNFPESEYLKGLVIRKN